MISPHTTMPVRIAASHDHIHRSWVKTASLLEATGMARRLISPSWSFEHPLRRSSVVAIRPPVATLRKRFGSSRLTDEPFRKQTSLLRTPEPYVSAKPYYSRHLSRRAGRG